MKFDAPLQRGTLIKRYKRFLADITTEDGRLITLHCPNTGSMKNCQEPGSSIWYTDSGNAKRKYPCTWQLIETSDAELVGINTGLANHLVADGVENGVLKQLGGFAKIRREVAYGTQKSRIDLLLENDEASPDSQCFVEVKNVSLGMGDGLGIFPDAVTTRGQKHLQELMEMRELGHRAALVFCVQHTGIKRIQSNCHLAEVVSIRRIPEFASCGS